MRKTLMVFSLSCLFLLNSCNKGKSSATWEENLKKDVASLKTRMEFLPQSGISESRMTMKEDDGDYIYTFVFDSFKKDQTGVRTLVQLKASEKEECFVYFGYEADYQIVTDKSRQDKSKNIIYGYVIFAKFDQKCSQANVFFHSEEYEEYFRINIS